MFDIVRLPSMLNLGDPQLTRFYLVRKAIMAGLLDKLRLNSRGVRLHADKEQMDKQHT